MHKNIILSIETSCDETSAAIVETGRTVRSNIISSQIDIHKKFGGVVPEIASRKHLETISYAVDLALCDAGLKFSDIDSLAVTYGPGLVGALLVGVSYAKGLAYALNKPLIGVNHIEGHISANYLENPAFEPPFICLVVSGGHTHIMKINSYWDFEVIGRTHDDAVGEAFDKVARAIGLGYPGGPMIDALAKSGDPDAYPLPTAFNEDGNYEFSFSGLKSAVLNMLNKAAMKGESINKADLAASFQKTVVKVLVKKTVSACKAHNLNRLALAGGVACNSALRDTITAEAKKNGLEINIPSPVFCTDNAAMIAACAFYSKPANLQIDSSASLNSNLHSSPQDFLYLNACPGL